MKFYSNVVIYPHGKERVQMKEITPGQNGLPRKKKNYSPEEKAIIVAKAAEVGTHTVADAYDIDWHSIASWKKYNAKQVTFKVKTVVIIQSPDGREITVDKIRAKVGTLRKFTSELTRVRLTGLKGKRLERLSCGNAMEIVREKNLRVNNFCCIS